MLAVIAFYIDYKDRQTQRLAQAWELVTRPAPGNSGKVPALEYLNSQGIELVGIDLSVKSNKGASYLAGVDLSWADLGDANLSGAVFFAADLSGAVLSRADLSGANLEDANNLLQESLDHACGDEETELPDGLTIKPCTD